jgi:hypothetical protein
VSTISDAWDAFTAAIVKARALHAEGAPLAVVLDLVTHARELIEIIEDEIATNPIAIPSAGGAVLAQLRGRLQILEKDVMPVRH